MTQLNGGVQKIERQLKIWIRDDDFVTWDNKFTRYIEFVTKINAIPLISIIAGITNDNDISKLAKLEGRAKFASHGFKHTFHGTHNGLKSEYPTERDIISVEFELNNSYNKIKRLGDNFLRVFVPPWNSIDSKFVPALINSNFSYVSLHQSLQISSLFPKINTNIDIFDWKNSSIKTFDTLKAEIIDLVYKLNHGELVGLLTHHRALSESDYIVLNDIFRWLNTEFTVILINPSEIFKG